MVSDLEEIIKDNIQDSDFGSVNIFNQSGKIIYDEDQKELAGKNITKLQQSRFRSIVKEKNIPLSNRAEAVYDLDKNKKHYVAFEKIDVGNNHLILTISTPKKFVISNLNNLKNKFIIMGIVFFVIIIIIGFIFYRFNKSFQVSTYLSFHDELTGLFNKRFFENKIADLNNKESLPVSIIIGDLDFLKCINDNYGHAKGDEYLKKAGELLDSTTRERDIVARIGGDEFALILPHTRRQIVEKIYSRIQNTFINFNEESSPAVPLSISLGYAVMVSEDQDLFEIVSRADTEMYKNKESQHRELEGKI